MTTDDLLTLVVSRLDELAARMKSVEDHLIGTMDRRGAIRRIEDVERCQRVSWLRERGTKAVDALILGSVVALTLLILTNGAKATIRDVVQSAQVSQSTRKQPIPMPPECHGRKDAVIPRVGWLDRGDD